MTEEEYRAWESEYESACSDLREKEERLEEVYAKLECDLELLGSTAIEDRLQENVAKTIEDLKTAGVKLWVLTGDKVETAVNIGFSCAILNAKMDQFLLTKLETVQEDIQLGLKE